MVGIGNLCIRIAVFFVALVDVLWSIWKSEWRDVKAMRSSKARYLIATSTTFHHVIFGCMVAVLRTG